MISTEAARSEDVTHKDNGIVRYRKNKAKGEKVNLCLILVSLVLVAIFLILILFISWRYFYLDQQIKTKLRTYDNELLRLKEKTTDIEESRLFQDQVYMQPRENRARRSLDEHDIKRSKRSKRHYSNLPHGVLQYYEMLMERMKNDTDIKKLTLSEKATANAFIESVQKFMHENELRDKRESESNNIEETADAVYPKNVYPLPISSENSQPETTSEKTNTSTIPPKKTKLHQSKPPPHLFPTGKSQYTKQLPGKSTVTRKNITLPGKSTVTRKNKTPPGKSTVTRQNAKSKKKRPQHTKSHSELIVNRQREMITKWLSSELNVVNNQHETTTVFKYPTPLPFTLRERKQEIIKVANTDIPQTVETKRTTVHVTSEYHNDTLSSLLFNDSILNNTSHQTLHDHMLTNNTQAIAVKHKNNTINNNAKINKEKNGNLTFTTRNSSEIEFDNTITHNISTAANLNNKRNKIPHPSAEIKKNTTVSMSTNNKLKIHPSKSFRISQHVMPTLAVHRQNKWKDLFNNSTHTPPLMKQRSSIVETNTLDNGNLTKNRKTSKTLANLTKASEISSKYVISSRTLAKNIEVSKTFSKYDLSSATFTKKIEASKSTIKSPLLVKSSVLTTKELDTFFANVEVETVPYDYDGLKTVMESKINSRNNIPTPRLNNVGRNLTTAHDKLNIIPQTNMLSSKTTTTPVTTNIYMAVNQSLRHSNQRPFIVYITPSVIMSSVQKLSSSRIVPSSKILFQRNEINKISSIVTPALSALSWETVTPSVDRTSTINAQWSSSTDRWFADASLVHPTIRSSHIGLKTWLIEKKLFLHGNNNNTNTTFNATKNYVNQTNVTTIYNNTYNASTNQQELSNNKTVKHVNLTSEKQSVASKENITLTRSTIKTKKKDFEFVSIPTDNTVSSKQTIEQLFLMKAQGDIENKTNLFKNRNLTITLSQTNTTLTPSKVKRGTEVTEFYQADSTTTTREPRVSITKAKIDTTPITLTSPITILQSNSPSSMQDKIQQMLKENNDTVKQAKLGTDVVKFLKQLLVKIKKHEKVEVKATRVTTTKSPNIQLSWKCRNDTTSWGTDYIIGMSRFLSNHVINCLPNEFLQEFQLSDNKDEFFPLFRYQFKCCRLLLTRD